MKATDPNGCQKTESCAVNLGPYLAPDPDTIVAKPKEGKPIVLIYPDSVYQYQWYMNGDTIPGATGQFYYAGSQGIDTSAVYKVLLTTDQGCWNFSKEYKYEQPDIQKLFEGSNDLFLIFPNPAEEYAWVTLNEQLTGSLGSVAMLRMYDHTGRLVMEKEMAGSYEMIGLNGLQEGIYLVEVIYGNGKRQVKKLIVR